LTQQYLETVLAAQDPCFHRATPYLHVHSHAVNKYDEWFTGTALAKYYFILHLRPRLPSYVFVIVGMTN